MKNYIKLRTVLDNIPASLFEEDTEASFLDRFMDGLKLLPNTIQYEPRIELFEIIDGKVQLPKYVKSINAIHWQATNPTSSMIEELTCEAEPADINPAVCKPLLTYQMWLDSAFFKETFKVLKYVGTDKSLINNGCECLYANCSETFVITPQKTMYLSIDSGWICVNYDSPVCDENQDILIPDNQLVIEFLVAYAISKHWENRQFTKESNAYNFYNTYNQKQALLLRQARGSVMLAQTDFADIANLNAQYTKLMKLPEILFYAR